MTEPELTKRRVVLLEVTLPKSSWSASELTAALNLHVPLLEPVVWGEVEIGCAKASRQKINQATREVEAGDSQSNVTHSLYKAGSFFTDIWPIKFYRQKISNAVKP